MSMYEAVREPDGTFSVYCTIQDGIEHEKGLPSLRAAKKWLVDAAKVYNHATLDPAKVRVGTRTHKVVDYVEWDDGGTDHVDPPRPLPANGYRKARRRRRG